MIELLLVIALVARFVSLRLSALQQARMRKHSGALQIPALNMNGKSDNGEMDFRRNRKPNSLSAGGHWGNAACSKSMDEVRLYLNITDC